MSDSFVYFGSISLELLGRLALRSQEKIVNRLGLISLAFIQGIAELHIHLFRNSRVLIFII